MEKAEIKKRLSEELSELLAIIIYLAVSFCLLATVKSVVLIQLGINNFSHGYVVALIEALALSKIVLLGQSIPLLKKIDHRPIVVSSSYKAAVMAMVVFLGSLLEEKLFAHHAAEAAMKQRLILDCTHIFALYLVFYALFIYRQLAAALGGNKLADLLCNPRH